MADYGTTACAFDVRIPFEPLWKQYKRVIKRNGAVVLFGSQPFTSMLIMSNLKWFKYELVWQKERPSAPGVAYFRPLPIHESLLVFGDSRITYNPIMGQGKPYRVSSTAGGKDHKFGFSGKPFIRVNDGERFPTSILPFQTKRHNSHPSEKPVALLSYLIKTYTDEGDTVLDSCTGSGSTGEACLRTGRRFIGIEKDLNYFNVAQQRLERVTAELRGELNHLPMFAEPVLSSIEGVAAV